MATRRSAERLGESNVRLHLVVKEDTDDPGRYRSENHETDVTHLASISIVAAPTREDRREKRLAQKDHLLAVEYEHGAEGPEMHRDLEDEPLPCRSPAAFRRAPRV